MARTASTDASARTVRAVFSSREGDVSALVDDRARPIFHGRLLLASLFLASISLYPPNNRIFASFVPDQQAVVCYFAALVVSGICSSVAIILYGSWKPAWSGWSRRCGLLSGMLYCLCQASVWLLVWIGAVGEVNLALLGTATGAFIAPIICRWIRAYDFGVREILFHGAIVCILSMGLTWVITLLPSAMAGTAVVACSIAGTFAAFSFQSEKTDAETPNNNRTDELEEFPTNLRTTAKEVLSITWLSLLGFLVSCFMMCSLSQQVAGVIDTECFGSVIAGVMALAVCLLGRRTSLVVLVDKLVLPVSLAICLVLGSALEGSPLFLLGMATIYGPLLFLALYGFSALAAVVNSGEFPLPLSFGCVFLVTNAVMLAGFALGLTVGQNGGSTIGEMSWMLISGYIAIVFVHLGYSAYRSLTSPRPVGGCDDLEAQADDTRPSPALRQERVASLAEEAHLSAREAEVLGFIARGYNSTYIANSLFISPNTSRTHIRNIYRKLDVNSREELLDHLNAER